jgi:APA family basic amino acid/polyamine antiporter
MFAAAATCTFLLLESTVLSATRLPFTMAEDGYFHPWLARLHPRYRTPARAIVLSVIFCGVLAPFSLPRLIAVYAWLRVATSGLTLLSLWRLRQTAPGLPRRFRVPGGRAGVAAVVCIPILLFAWALINSDPEARRWGLLALVSGPVAYAIVHGSGASRSRSVAAKG